MHGLQYNGLTSTVSNSNWSARFPIGSINKLRNNLHTHTNTQTDKHTTHTDKHLVEVQRMVQMMLSNLPNDFVPQIKSLF